MSSLSKELSALGSLFQVTETLVTQAPSKASVSLCLYNPLRWALLMLIATGSMPQPGIALSAATLLAGGGMLLTPQAGVAGGGTLPATFWFRDHGPLAQQQWFGGAVGGALPSSNVVWTVYEVLLLPG